MKKTHIKNLTYILSTSMIGKMAQLEYFRNKKHYTSDLDSLFNMLSIELLEKDFKKEK